MPNIQVGTLQVVSKHGPLLLLGCSIMSHRRDLDLKEKDPLGDDYDGMTTEGK